MVDEQEELLKKIRLAIEEGQRAMDESEQKIVDAKKVREQVKSEMERKLPKAGEKRPKA